MSIIYCHCLKWNFVTHLLLQHGGRWTSALSGGLFTDELANILSHLLAQVDLTSQVENEGNDLASELLLAILDLQAKHLAYLVAVPIEGEGKAKSAGGSLPV
ncbi:hypothetical protein RJ641_032615 [Dillenia turbinata]|uniref:Uncharacterized protein n=1 Tax=Dillenia turbinata TaxID=194707 RepID=A0AAN8ZIM5_9MAGN